MICKRSLSLGCVLLSILAPACSKEEKPQFTKVRSSFDSDGNDPACRYSCAAFSPDGKYVLLGYSATRGTGSNRKDVSFPYLIALDSETGNEINGFRQEKDDIRVQRILPLPDNRRAVVVDELGTLILVDYVDGKVIWQQQAFARVDNAAVSVDGKHLYVQGFERYGDHPSPAALRRWDLSGAILERNLQTIDPGRSGHIVRFTPLLTLGSELALIGKLASPHGETFIWNISKAEKTHRFEMRDATPFAVSHDGRYILCHPHRIDTWLERDEFTLWDVAAGRWEEPNKKLWAGPIVTVVRKREVGNPVFVRFWDLDTAQSIRDVEVSPGSSSGVMLSSDSRLAFVHGSGANNRGVILHVWNLDLAKEIWQRVERRRR